MIQNHPVCFGCEEPIDDPQQVVFAPPWCDHPGCCSATFHGIHLMEWREKRQEIRTQIERRMEAFRRHAEGECDCP